MRGQGKVQVVLKMLEEVELHILLYLFNTLVQLLTFKLDTVKKGSERMKELERGSKR